MSIFQVKFVENIGVDRIDRILGGDIVYLLNRTYNMKKTDILGLRTVIYMVDDLKQAKEWYAKAFGTEPYFDEAFYVGFNIGGYELGLLPEEKSKEGKGEGAIAYWGVEDIDSVFKGMIDLGAEVHGKPTNVGGELMVASLIDPWGNMIGLIYNPDFKLSDS